ncbi:MAG: hypothetical protein HZA50_11475 [Planctomycetes bacterium]|nr:hypothetical protein [Planctomycetota bacterium]
MTIRIDKSNIADPNGVNQGNVGRNKVPTVNEAPTPMAQASSAQVVVSYGKYVDMAKRLGDSDERKISEAKKDKDQGDLDTPEAAKRAAQAILSRGI